MLIIGDEGEYHGRFPWVTVWLLVINVVMLIPTELIGEPFIMGLSMVPEEIITGQDLVGPKATKIWVYERIKTAKTQAETSKRTRSSLTILAQPRFTSHCSPQCSCTAASPISSSICGL